MRPTQSLLSLFEKKFTTPSGGPNPHTHGAETDDEGNGKTVSTSDGPDHVHDIIRGAVQPAGVGPHGHEKSAVG